MPDKEKVIYDIERCISHVQDACIDCSKYSCEVEYGPIPCMEVLLSDALALLKEQEAVKTADKPTDALSMIDEYRWKHTMGRCGNCKAHLPALDGLRSKFCWMCGKAVKWDA